MEDEAEYVAKAYRLEYYPQWGEDAYSWTLRSDFKERIVRCRDCEHHMSMGITQGWLHMCTIGETLRIIEPDGFCKWGEQRKEE